MHIDHDPVAGGEHSHPHTHEHTHTHSHEHTHTHEHPHDHEHLHADGTSHDHTHTPMEELLALMKYMVGHNAAHAKELSDLASQLKDTAGEEAYQKVMSAVADFDKGNEKISEALKELGAE
ncbi:MAG: hypothetical protein ACI4PH_11075 [Faecousia sp.]